MSGSALLFFGAVHLVNPSSLAPFKGGGFIVSRDMKVRSWAFDGVAHRQWPLFRAPAGSGWAGAGADSVAVGKHGGVGFVVGFK